MCQSAAAQHYNHAIGKAIGQKQSDTIVFPIVQLSFNAVVRWDYRPNPNEHLAEVSYGILYHIYLYQQCDKCTYSIALTHNHSLKQCLL